ncbi:MAG TPA: hypothetical protein VG297_11135 [Bryobacteraceae bacterium]|jgi:hypothetical protein|nr:hypothetical protein [Bryobacteraceae bacterium]
MLPVAAVEATAATLMAGAYGVVGSDVHNSDAVGSDGAPGASDPVAAFRNLVAQIVAESESASLQPSAASNGTLAEKPSSLASLNVKPLPTPTANVEPSAAPQTSLPPATHADRRRTDSTAKDRSPDDDKKQPVVVVPFVPPLPTPVMLPPPVTTRGERSDTGSADDARSGIERTAPQRPTPDSPEIMALQPPPVLQLRIHSQPAEATVPPAPAPTTSAPPAMAVPPAVPKAAAQAPAALPVVEAATKERTGPQPESGSRQDSDDRPPDNHSAKDAQPPANHPPANQPENKAASDTTPRTASIPDASSVIPHAKVENGPAAPAPLPQPVSTPSTPLMHVTLPSPPEVTSEPKQAPAAAASPSIPEPPPETPKAPTPMRSLALEFTPDGAHDIKVRLSEHSGDVHISLHGTDPALAGRVREGVSDLVGSLARAGYDAEAWSPGQDGRGQRRQPEPDKRARFRPETGEEFSGMLQQPIEEIQ